VVVGFAVQTVEPVSRQAKNQADRPTTMCGDMRRTGREKNKKKGKLGRRKGRDGGHRGCLHTALREVFILIVL
jgi:hypothetical protein